MSVDLRQCIIIIQAKKHKLALCKLSLIIIFSEKSSLRSDKSSRLGIFQIFAQDTNVSHDQRGEIMMQFTFYFAIERWIDGGKETNTSVGGTS